MINLGLSHSAADGVIKAEIPFPKCGAMSQGYIGYHLQNAIARELHARGLAKNVVTLVTQVEVDAADPAFKNPTKPIGAFYSEAEAKENTAADPTCVFKEDAGRGWRQVVASPIPKRIVEFDAVRDLVEDGYVVVSTGGGGVPVFETGDGYVGTPAVIDKDRSSALMAAELGADMLIILTAVEKVNIHKANMLYDVLDNSKLFTVAGPVLVYGITASLLYGLVLWALQLFH